MKFNILINQKEIIEQNIDIDIMDAAILDFVLSFSHSNKIVKIQHKNTNLYWFSHKTISENLPILKLKKDSIYRRLKKMVDIGLLTKYTTDSNQTFYGFTEMTINLFFAKGSDFHPRGVGFSSEGGADENPTYNNIIYNNNSIKDNTNVLSKKKFFEQNEDCFSDDLKNEKSFQKKVAPKKSFSIPSVEEIRSYCIERQNYVDPEKFHSHYTSVGWKVGKNQMKDWKAAVRTWEKNYNNKANYNGTEQQPQQERFIGRQSQQQVIDALEREQACSYDPRFRE